MRLNTTPSAVPATLLLGALLARPASAALPKTLDGSSGGIPATSSAASRLLSKSRRLNGPPDGDLGGIIGNGGRTLQENEENVGWMVGYSLKFDSCHEIATVGGGEGEGGGGGECREGGAGGCGQAALQKLIKFRLCPTSSCSKSCAGGGEYVVQLREFLESYVEAKREMEERQNQNNGNNNNGNGNGEEFEIQRFLECEPLNEGGGDNNNNGNYNGGGYQYYYTGAYCGAGGNAVYLGVFSDPTCSTRVSSSIYANYMYYSLPYSTESLVGKDCLSCNANEYDENNYNYNYNYDNNNNNNNNNNQNGNNNQNQNYEEPEVFELCEELHERSAKCESRLNVKSYNSNQGQYYGYYPHTESCQFIQSTLSSLESVSKTNGRSLTVARTFAWIFGLSTLGLVGFLVWDKIVQKNFGGGRRTVDLSSQDVLPAIS